MQVFAQIRKVDEQKRLVFGRAAEEAVDKSGEIMDYVTSKPHFVNWSDDIAKDTGGKSLGNVRAMHGKVAAGKLTGIEFNDAEKAIDVCAKIVDDSEWKKVLEGVYTGFSIGGAYVGAKKVEKVDGQDVTRYTASPTEVSLVDRPCMPGAKFFEVQKVDGTLGKVEFKGAADGDETDGGTVQGTPEEVDQLVKVMAEKGLTLAQVIELAKMNPFAKPKDGEAPPKEEGGGEHKEPDGDEAAAAAAAAAAAEPAGAGPDAPKREMTPEERKAAEEAKPAATKAVDADLQKLQESGALNKLLSDAIAAAVEPLQKALGEAQAGFQTITKELDSANQKIAKLEAQPAAPRVSLRAVTKGDDVVDLKKADPLKPIIDDRGEEHQAAALIKFAHRGGGAPLTKPAA